MVSQIQPRGQQMSHNSMENAAVEEQLQITFEHLKLNNTEGENGMLIFFSVSLPELCITF